MNLFQWNDKHMAKNNQFHLFKIRRFAPFFWTQFLGAFNDNVFKNALVIYIGYQSTLNIQQSDTLINICQGLFILPFFLFSATAGLLADKYEKSLLIRYIKLCEIGIMLLAAIAFYNRNIHLLVITLFILGTQAAFFGPVKYAILPQNLKDKELMGGNGLVEMGTFIAILVGTIFGGIAIALPHYSIQAIACVTIGLALLGWRISCLIPNTPPADPTIKMNWNIIKQNWINFRYASERRDVLIGIIGNSWFWFFGMVFFAQVTNYAKVDLGGNEHIVTLLLTVLSVGIGIGSILCDRLALHKIELGLIPLGSIGVTLFAIDLFLANPQSALTQNIDIQVFLMSWSHWRVLADLLLIGIFGGLYIVPLYAMIQQRSKAQYRSRIIAASNMINAFFMVISTLYAIVLLNYGYSISQLFLFTGILNAIVATALYLAMPEFIMRFIVWIWMFVKYQIKTTDLDKHLPEERGALLIYQYTSYYDMLILMAAIPRPIRFIAPNELYAKPLLRFLLNTARAIKVPFIQDSVKQEIYSEITTAVAEGDLVAIFRGDAISQNKNTEILAVEMDNLIKHSLIPVIPILLDKKVKGRVNQSYGKTILNFLCFMRTYVQVSVDKR